MINLKVSDSQIVATTKDVIERFRSNALEYKDGKEGLLGFFVGKVHLEWPEADPAQVNGLVKKELERVNVFKKSDSEKEQLKRMKAEFKRNNQ